MKQKKMSDNFNPEQVEIDAETDVQIKDYDAHKEYQKICKHPIFNELSSIELSDGKIYKPATIWKWLEKATKHLPEADVRKIKAAHKMYVNMNTKRMSIMRKAYGGLVKLNKTDSGEVKGVKLNNALDLKREEIIELFGRMYSIKEVHEICLTKLKTKCSVEQLKSFRTKYQTEIASKTEHFKRNYTDMRLSIKRGRLEELVDLYNQRKRIYQISKKADDHRLLMATLEQIRKEAEGDSIRLEGQINIDVNQIINHQIQSENLGIYNIAEIVLARIAAKSNVPVSMFLAKVNTSWYSSRLFNKNIEDVDFTEIQHPTTQSYDFNQIAKINEEERITMDNKIKTARKADQIDDAKRAVVIDLKSSLAEKILALQSKVNGVQTDIKDRITD